VKLYYIFTLFLNGCHKSVIDIISGNSLIIPFVRGKMIPGSKGQKTPENTGEMKAGVK